MSHGLLDNEQAVLRLKPHLFSQIKKYLFWIYVLLLNLVWVGALPSLGVPAQAFFRTISSESVISRIIFELPDWAAWSLLHSIPALVIGAIRLDWRGLLGFLTTLILVLVLASQYPELKFLEPRCMLYLSILMLLYKELQRLSTEYIITNQRIIIIRRGVRETTRTLFYSKIHDLILSRDLLGRILGYGTIVPLTASQLGIGASESSISAGARGGAGGAGANIELGLAHSQKEVSPSADYSLYCIPSAEKTYQAIISQMGIHQGSAK
jgi:hypothetical protein